MNEHTAPRRVALYARYSTDMQNPMSVDDQFRLAERYAAREGWVVVERFSDRRSAARRVTTERASCV